MMVEAPCARRSASAARPGTICSPAEEWSGWPPSSAARALIVAISGTRRTIWSRSGSQLSAPRPPAAALNSANGTTALVKCAMNGRGSSPAVTRPNLVGKSTAAPSWVRIAPSAVGVCPIACASKASLDVRSLASCVSSVRPGEGGSRAISRSGLDASGSANRMSTATTAAPRPPRRVTISAMVERGHGHWPMRASESSSISRILTGASGSHAIGSRR